MKMNKQGSALLIVLGFLSFMVVSAVAFAIYMRAERMPSSALRRAVATRHLVKAALAEAISRVDDAVRDDPFPGLTATNNNGTVADSRFYYFRGGSGGNQAIDVWTGRVFMPPDAQGGTVDAETRYAPVTETVSTLTLEGLGYVPPPLVNDVRFLSRSSWAASWQQFPFDAGRFAYCAVNVSDYLDVNRVSANKARTSEPQRRLSLAHLFDPNFDPTDAVNGNTYRGSSVENPDNAAETFDNFTGKRNGSPYTGYVAGDNVGGSYEKWDAIGNTAPYVSVMDYNLALAAGGPSSFMKPLYYNWLADVRRDQSYYIHSTSRSSDMSVALRQPFVTESWSTNEKWRVDFATRDGQPFYGNGLENLIKSEDGSTTYMSLRRKIKTGDTFLHLMGEGGASLLGDADYATLYDYLDHDDVPLSLALPCVESVPMIVGITPPTLVKMAPITTPGPSSAGPGAPETTTWNFNPQEWFSRWGGVKVAVACPFKRHSQDRGGSSSFDLQVLLKVVLAPAGVDRSTLAASVRPANAMDVWDESKIGWRMEGNTFHFTCLSQRMTSFTIPQNVTEESDAYARGGGSANGVFTFMFSEFPVGQLAGSQIPVFEKIKTDPPENAPPGTAPTTEYKVHIAPLGMGLENRIGQPIPGQEFENAIAGKELVPHVFVWARVLSADGARMTVDMVPASPDDDRVNGKSEDPMLTVLSPLTGESGAGNRPLFGFDCDAGSPAKFSFAKVIGDGSFQGFEGDPQWKVKGAYAVDPRFNHSPQFWFKAPDENVTFDNWLKEIKTARRNVAHADPDIFMFTSNQGFLQSLGEFAFLPYLHDPGTSATFGLQPVDTAGQGDFGATAKDVMDRFTYLWRTYDLNALHEFYTRSAQNGIGRSLQGECLVNPHTDNLGVMMAALANTPYDYWAAGAGVDEDSLLFKALGNTNSKGLDKLKIKDASKKYAFNKDNTGSKIRYDELVRIAKTIMGAMGGIDLSNGDSDIVQAIRDVFSEVKVGDVRGPIAKILKNEIRNNGVLPSNAWQILWDDLWSVLALDKGYLKDEGALEELLGVPLSEPLHYVDRKYLYSYWRDCFANNQQLFLIFVRAESSALGGPGEGTPGQLGGRAVALVWRDPNWSVGNGDNGRDRDVESQYSEVESKMRPHRTRVLFYHQFD